MVAAALPARFAWIASIHPCRAGAVAALAEVVESGARSEVVALGGIDPASPLRDSFYEALARHDLPLLSYDSAEYAILGGDDELNNPLRLRAVRLIRCARDRRARGLAASGRWIWIGWDGPRSEHFMLFARMMDEPRYQNYLYGDVSSIAQINRPARFLREMRRREDWHPRLLNGADHPLPAMLPLFALCNLAREGFVGEQEAEALAEIRRYNALLFDCC